jgi:hypothetical protein
MACTSVKKYGDHNINIIMILICYWNNVGALNMMVDDGALRIQEGQYGGVITITRGLIVTRPNGSQESPSLRTNGFIS